MKALFGFVILILLSSSLWGETFQCVYREGEADYRKGDRWIPLDFGTGLEENTVIRLSENAAVQLDSATRTLFFSRSGEYTLPSGPSEEAAERDNTLDRLSQKINRLLTSQKEDATVAMGIRGNAADPEEGLSFGTTRAEDLDRAWEKIAREDYAGAEADLEYFYSLSADPYSESRLLFSLAYAEEMLGKTGEAWNHLNAILLPEQEDYYPSYLLLSGRISLKSQNYEEAAQAFQTFLEQFPQSEAAAEVRELLALSRP
ncbi:MAG: hypothetical protein PQJ60_11130 [Spirochaetales bacterium]|nr:hypothetical protein [Spirochaetales bacterium]